MIRRLVHFLLLGAIVFALDRRESQRVVEPDIADRTIVIDGATVAAIRERWRDASGFASDEATLRTLVAAAVDEEVLFREALRAGLDRGDAVVWRRLVDNLRFVAVSSPSRASRDLPEGGAADARDESELHREARRLGMERSDAVVRKRLVERMTELLRARAATREATEAEIAAWLAAHGERAREADRVRLKHVFFSRARRGARALADARAEGPSGGDPFLHGGEFAGATRRELERMLGPDVANAAFAAERRTWLGPVESAYGAHWLRVGERYAGTGASRKQAEAAIRRKREDEALRNGIAKLRSRYSITSPLWGEDPNARCAFGCEPTRPDGRGVWRAGPAGGAGG